MHIFENLNTKFRSKTMQIDLKVCDCRLYVEGNHDCDIETCMRYVNSDQIFFEENVKE